VPVNTRLFMKDASIKIVVPPGAIAGATEYDCDVNTVEVLSKPGSPVIYQTLCPGGALTQVPPSTYSVRLKGVQDWATDGLSLFLWMHAGATARIVVNAHGATAAYAAATPGFDAQVTLVEGSYGGEAGKWAEFDVELPCISRPTLLTTAPTSEEAAAEPEADELAATAA
jgi:hypothetical protein